MVVSGRTIEDIPDSKSDVLLFVTVPVVPRADCERSLGEDWAKAYGPTVDLDSVFCAGLLEGGQDSCQVRKLLPRIRDRKCTRRTPSSLPYGFRYNDVPSQSGAIPVVQRYDISATASSWKA